MELFDTFVRDRLIWSRNIFEFEQVHASRMLYFLQNKIRPRLQKFKACEKYTIIIIRMGVFNY